MTWSSGAALTKPAGTINGRGQPTAPRYLDERAAGIHLVGSINQSEMEKVTKLNTNLILAGRMPDEQLALLRQVASTVVTYKSGDDWKTHFRQTATALNKETEASTFLTDYDRKVQSTKSRLGPNVDAEVSIVRWNPTGPGYMLSNSFASYVVSDLGLRRPAGQQGDGPGHSPPLSLEAMEQIDGDWLFFGTLSSEGDAVQAMETAKQHLLFKQLDAVKNNHVVAIDGSLWTSVGGPLAALAVLDDVDKAMTAR